MLKNDNNRRDEHETVRNNVGFYDFTHQLVDVTGTDAAQFLDRIFVNSIADTDVGKAQYSTMLNEDAIIIDDVIIFRLEKDRYWISTLFVDQMLDWLEKNKKDFSIEFKEITDQVSMYAVQGPDSVKLLNKILDKNIDDLGYFNIIDNKIEDFDVKVARAGFTGELGFEVYLHPDHTDDFEDLLREHGKEFNVESIDTDVKLKSLPVEKGFVLMSDLEGLTPLEANFGWSVDWDSDFIGKDVLEKAKSNGSNTRLRGYTVNTENDSVDNVEIEDGAAAKVNGEEVGKVTSFTYGYTVEDYIGFVAIDKEKAPKDSTFTISSGGTDYEAVTHERIFYDKDNERVRG